MPTIKQLFGLSIVIVITLLLRDLPYANVIFINKIWLLYLLILLLIILSSMKFKVTLVSYLTGFLFFVAFLLTLLKLTFFAEAIGALIYFSLWIVLVHQIILFYRQSR
ncbi:hypothetical protein A3A79_05060 [Candidatus Gottesmanbacteria bacterium RIFCSPLOWO2_01_FULL_43_11b]|uniref:Uncharacterized protein n=1 Tax=Candidatus Gottesmanbacteria bacterium RIFCSPLOWO2_01_FULL_43_11b TaxID=1798392 RepID=A0A1F6AIH4_9BACT|nr:MAG: hypothetical protein A3A79_05060 [Candidatus Gottesmanbacteria bacterium RIFCSPLOWO2_01_FULL_43_11b]